VEQRSAAASVPELAEDNLGFFRWGRVAGQVLVSNDAGDWTFLSEPEFADLLAGRVTADHARFEELQRKGFVRDGLDIEALTARMAQRNQHLRRGPWVHVVNLTRRRAAAAGGGGNGAAASSPDMSTETIERIVNFVLQSPSPSIDFEIQGDAGEPLFHLDGLRHLVEFAQARNQRETGKALTFRVLSNFTGLTEAAAEWLIADEVRVSTRLDGPADVHDANCQHLGGSAYADVARWIDYFHRRYGELGRDPRQWRVEALMNTTRRTLAAGTAVVDEYVARGLSAIHLQPLEAWQFDADTWAAIGYEWSEYLEFYRHTLDYILDLNRRGVEIAERQAGIFAAKILTFDDPGIVDIQSPSGAGTGQLVYDVDGRMFPCDEARIAAAMGDPLFELGRAGELSIAEIVRHPTVRAIAAASLLDAQPMCGDCWNKPFCGFSPVRNFLSQGDLFGQRPRCLECKEHMAVSRRVFELLADADDPASADALKRWGAPAHATASRRAQRAAP